MHIKTISAAAVLFAATITIHIAAQQAPAQQPPATPQGGGRGQGPGGGQGRGGNPFAASYPERPPADPAKVDRGKTLYGASCAFCHGVDARGGATGPNLLRSQLVLNDKDGELMAPVVQNGRPERGMPPLNLTNEQVSDVAAFVHSFRVGGYDVSRVTPPSILVGDAAAGEAVFKAKCGPCHSATGDLKEFGAKFSDPKQLQQTWLMPSGGGGRGGFGAPTNVPPTTVTVTLASGQKVEGTLVRIDDFVVSLAEADGTPRSFRRFGDSPKVDVHDPLEPHRQLLPKYTDKEIHDLTAYLVTLK